LLLHLTLDRAQNRRAGADRIFGRAGLRLDIQRSSRSCRQQQRAATTQTPRRPIGAGGARGASRSGSVSVITTHALFALKVQRKLSNGVAGFAAGRSSWIGRNRGPSCLVSDPLASQPPRRTLAEDPKSTRPELRIRNLAAQTRIVSGGKFRRS